MYNICTHELFPCDKCGADICIHQDCDQGVRYEKPLCNQCYYSHTFPFIVDFRLRHDQFIQTIQATETYTGQEIVRIFKQIYDNN